MVSFNSSCFTPKAVALVPVVEEAGWAPEQVSTLEEIKSLVPARN
jgi:hypothetical protein